MAVYGNSVLREASLDKSEEKKYYEKLNKKVISIAKKNMLNEKDIKNFAQSYSEEEAKENEKLLKEYKLGIIYKDPGDNYYLYSFKNNKIYFFDHEEDFKKCISRGNLSIEKFCLKLKDWESNDIEASKILKV